MSLIIKAAQTMPVRIDIDLDTDAGRIKGYFTGHARVFSKTEGAELSTWITRLSNWVRHLKGLDHDVVTDEDRRDFAEVTEANADEVLMRRMYLRFDGLANESGPLEGDAAWQELLYGKLSFSLYNAALDAFWLQRNQAREGNARPSRAR